MRLTKIDEHFRETLCFLWLIYIYRHYRGLIIIRRGTWIYIPQTRIKGRAVINHPRLVVNINNPIDGIWSSPTMELCRYMTGCTLHPVWLVRVMAYILMEHLGIYTKRYWTLTLQIFVVKYIRIYIGYAPLCLNLVGKKIARASPHLLDRCRPTCNW